MREALTVTTALFAVAIAIACGGGGGGAGHGKGGGDLGTFQIAGTQWEMQYVDTGRSYEVRLYDGGHLATKASNDSSKESYALTGGRFTWTLNGTVAFTGDLVGHHTILGEARWIAGKDEGDTATFRMIRTPAPGELVCSPGAFADDVSGTTWEIHQRYADVARWTAHLMPGGKLVNKQSNDWRTESWSQSGREVTWTLNDTVAFTGTLVGDHTLVGTQRNVDTGETKPFYAWRQPTPGEASCL